MKRTQTIFVILLALSFLCSCTDKQESNEISITGEFTNVEDGVVISLYETNDEATAPFISDTIRNGEINISYTDTIAGLKKIWLKCKGEGFPSSHLTLWVSPGSRTVIDGKSKMPRNWDVKSTAVEQNEQRRYVIESNRNVHRSQVLLCEIDALAAEIEESPEKETELRKQINALRVQKDSIDLLIEKKDLAVMKRYPTYSAYWMDLLKEYSLKLRHDEHYPYREQVLALYDRLPEEKKNSDEGQAIAANLFP